jgi:hypothetical protein
MSSIFPTQPTDAGQLVLQGGDAAKLAFYKKQCEIFLRERQANAARHKAELAEARLEGEKQGIIAGFNMARQFPDLREPPSFSPDTLESPDTKLSNTMRLTSMVGPGHATPTTRNPPATPASNRPAMLSFNPHTQHSPTPGANNNMYAKPLAGSAGRSGSRNAQPATVYGVSHGQISPMLHQHDNSYQLFAADNQDMNNSPIVMFNTLPHASAGSFFDSAPPMNTLQGSPMASTMSSQSVMENAQPTDTMTIDNTGDRTKAGTHGSTSYSGDHTGISLGQTGHVQVSNTPFMDAMASANDMSGGMFGNGQDGFHHFNQ